MFPSRPLSDDLERIYHAKTRWPPDFSKLNPRRAFMLERKFKRRANLKWARPIWHRNIKLLQFTSIVGVVVWGVFFYDWDKTKDPPFQDLRRWTNEKFGALWTQAPRPDFRTEARRPSEKDP